MGQNVNPLLESDFSQSFAKDSFKVIANMILDMEAKNFNFTNLDKIFTIASGLALVLGTKIIGASSNPKTIPRVMGLIIGAMIGGQVTKALPIFKGTKIDMKLSTMKFVAGIVIGPTFKPMINVVGKILSTVLKPFISMPSAKNMMDTTTGSAYNGKLAASFYVHIILGFGIGALGMWMYAKRAGVTLLNYKAESHDDTQANQIIDKIITEKEGGKTGNVEPTKRMSPIKEFKGILKQMISEDPRTELKGLSTIKVKLATLMNAAKGETTQDSSMKGMVLGLIKTAWQLADEASKGELNQLCDKEIYMVNRTSDRVDTICVSSKGTIIIAINPDNTALHDMSDRELAAVLLHELGHYASKHFSHSFATVFPLTLLQFIPDMLAGPESIFLRGSISYYEGALGKFHEIQADKYAIERGYGRELATALKLLVGKYVEKHNYDNYEVNGNTNLRIQAIFAESSNYDRFK